MSLLAAALLFAAAPQPATFVKDAYPVLSPDGAALLFQSTRSGRWALWISAPDGSSPKILIDSGDDPVTPSWSPDGARIAYAATIDGESQIFVADANGSNRRQITDTKGDNSHPHFGSNGRLYFNSARATPDPDADWSDQHHDIYSMKADGSDLQRHTECMAVCTFPSLSPDGTHLAFRRVVKSTGRNWAQENITKNSEVFVKRLKDGEERNVSADPAFDGWPVWTPDSRYVVFASNRSGVPNVGQNYAVRPDGTGLARLTQDSWSNVQPSFSPDGNTLFTYRHVEDATGEFGHIAKTAINLP